MKPEPPLEVSAIITADSLERIADSLERLVIAADSIATALSLQTLARIPYETGASRGKTGEWPTPRKGEQTDGQ